MDPLTGIISIQNNINIQNDSPMSNDLATVNLSSAASNETRGMMIGPPSIEEAKSVGADRKVLNSTGYVPEVFPAPIGAPEPLNAQNAYRAAVGESPLVWSATLASSAQTWAKHLADTNTFEHSCPGGGCGYGENLAAGWPSSSWTDTSLVNLWGNEKQYFKCGYFPAVSTTGNWQDVGHYTQVVWPTTTQCGCGEAISSADHKILVCQYQPPGNVMGQYICPQSNSNKLALQAYNGQFVCAEGSGGDGVVANRNAIGAWETFNLIDRGNGNVALQAANGQYVCAEGGGGHQVVANRNAIGAWETFKLIDRGNGNYALQAANGQYVCAEGSGGDGVVANRNAIGAWETFRFLDLSRPANVALQAANGQYVCAEGSGGDGVVANRNAVGAWETFKLIGI